MENEIFRQNARNSGRILTHFLLHWNVGLGNPCRIDLPIFWLSQKRAQECQGTSAAQPLKEDNLLLTSMPITCLEVLVFAG